MRARLYLTVGFFLISIFHVEAQRLINIDFGAHTNPAFSIKTGKAATGLTDQDFWNLYSRDGAGGSFLNSSQLLDLKLSDGVVTDADLFVTNAPGAWYTFSSDAMFQSYLYPGNPNIDVLLSGVPNGNYDIFVYAHGQPPEENSVIQVASGPLLFPEKATSTAQNWDSLGWREGSQFVVFTNVAVDSTQSLSILVKRGAANIAVINGIQLLEVVSNPPTNSAIFVHQPPTDQVVPLSASAQMLVVASSELPLSYQWFFNGIVIPNATNSSLQIDSTTAFNVGNYQVVIRNGHATVSPSEVFLQVYTPVLDPLLNIDFGAHLNPFLRSKSGPAALGKTDSDRWNLYSRDGADGSYLDNNFLADLVWSDGTQSSIRLNVSNAAGAWNTFHRDPMFESYLYPGSHTGDINGELLNLPPGTYDLLVYAHGQTPSENGVIQVQTDSQNFGTKTTSTASNWNLPAWTEGRHYVLFESVMVQSGEKLRITSKPGQHGESVINGAQLVRRQAAPSDTITVLNQPADAYVPHGGTHEFIISAESGLPLTYQWFFQNQALIGATGATLRVENATATNVGAYRISISNSARTVSSKTANLQVFSVVSSPLLNIDFGAHLNPFLHQKTGPAAIGKTLSDRWNLYSRDGTNGDWLDNNQLSNLLWSDGAVSEIRVSASNAGGVWYTLDPDPMFESYLYPQSHSGSINAVVERLPAGRYDIYVYAHGQIPSENGVVEVATDSFNFGLKVSSAANDWDVPAWTEGSHYLLFKDVAINQGERLKISAKPGQGGLAVINGIQILQKSANPGSNIVITTQPQDVIVARGATAEFSVAASGPSPLSYQWYLNGSPLAAATNSNLRVENASSASVGAYRAVVGSGGESLLSAVAHLQVFSPVAEPLLNIDFGAHLNPFLRTKVGPAAVGKNLSDQWNLYSRDGTNGAWLETNQLNNLVWSDGASSTIKLAVTNASGAWYTLNNDPMFESYLYPGPRAGDILAELAELPEAAYDIYVYAHGQIPGENGVIELSTQSGSYGTKQTSTSEEWDSPAWTEGNHFVLFQNVIVLSNETLQVRCRPGVSGLSVINGLQLVKKDPFSGPNIFISRQPQDAVLPIGSTAELSVAARSGLALQYQWFLHGNIISGATSAVLRFENIRASDAGSYHLSVRNSETSVTSRSARLDTFLAVEAPLINIDFGAHLNPAFSTKQGPAAIGKTAADQWNLYSRDDAQGGWQANGELSNLLWSEGSASGIRLSVSNAAGAWYTLNKDPMFESYLYPLSRQGNIDAIFSRLPAGKYSLYVYSHGQIPEENGVVDVSTDSTSYGARTNSFDGNWDLGFWSEAGQYVKFENVEILPGEKLKISSKPGISGLAVINGIQLLLKEGLPVEFRPTVADWTFEEGVVSASATAANDYSGNGLHLSQPLGAGARFISSDIYTDGSISLHLPASDGGFGNALRAADSVDFNLGGQFTIEASLTPGAQNSEFNRGVVVGQDALSGRLAYGLDYRSENRAIHFFVVDPQGQDDFVEARIPDDGKSHHVAGVYSAGALKIYLDKTLIQSKSTSIVPGISPGGAARVTLGANDIGGYWFHGTLDRVRISREALTPEEFFPHRRDPGTPLTILQPLENLAVDQGATATFRVTASGPSDITYSWLFNNQLIPNQSSNTLVLHNVRLADAGTYKVTVRSGQWEASSVATLTVGGVGGHGPVILVQPTSRVVGIGNSAQFSVTASGISPLAYQWFFNGAILPGETNNVFWVSGVEESDAGTYYVIVSDVTGSTISQGAVLNTFSSSASGGEVYLDNHIASVDAPVTDDQGNLLAGPEFLAQLFASASGAPVPVGPAIPFKTGIEAGYFSDIISRVIPGTSSGGSATLQVRVWEARTGTTYAQAVENGGLHGESISLNLVLGGGAQPPVILDGLQPFSLSSRPRIVQPPADTTVFAGRAAYFSVTASGSAPLNFQWKFNGVPIPGATVASLVLSNVTTANAGPYTVEIRNNIGSVVSSAAQLTVLPRDTEAPVVTLTSPAPGITTSNRVTLAGQVSDNQSIARVEWLRNGQMVGPVGVSDGSFSVPNLLLIAGTNIFSVRAYDEDGNVGAASVAVILETQRVFSIGAASPVQEGARVSFPVLLTSSGEIGAVSFSVSFDTNYFAEPGFAWSSHQSGAFTQVNTDTLGTIRATFVLPGRTIHAGTNTVLATVQLRARSVPETLTSPIGLDVQGVYSAAGDSISSGTTAALGEVQIVRRKYIGDNNANDRLDVGDASAVIRMLTLLDPARAWDVTGNDLNSNSSLDAGDIVRILRAVVNIDPQPSGLLSARSLNAAAEVSDFASLVLSPDHARIAPGETLRVQIALTNRSASLSGASFQLAYPANALRLEDAASHQPGALVPQNAMAIWNLVPDQNYEQQSGTLHFAASTAVSWPATNGVLAELTFKVLDGAASQYAWPVRITQAEASSGLNLIGLGTTELLLTTREPQPAQFSAGTFNSASGNFEFRLTGESGIRYKVESSIDLQIWTEIGLYSDASGSVLVSDPIDDSSSRRFYRAIQVQ